MDSRPFILPETDHLYGPQFPHHISFNGPAQHREDQITTGCRRRRRGRCFSPAKRVPRAAGDLRHSVRLAATHADQQHKNDRIASQAHSSFSFLRLRREAAFGESCQCLPFGLEPVLNIEFIMHKTLKMRIQKKKGLWLSLYWHSQLHKPFSSLAGRDAHTPQSY